MTREESLEALCVAFEKLDEDEQRGMIRLIEQMKRAHTFGLDFLYRRCSDQHRCCPAADEYSYCGSMAGRLRERSSRRMTLQGDILAVASVLWYNMSVVQTLFQTITTRKI